MFDKQRLKQYAPTVEKAFSSTEAQQKFAASIDESERAFQTYETNLGQVSGMHSKGVIDKASLPNTLEDIQAMVYFIFVNNCQALGKASAAELPFSWTPQGGLAMGQVLQGLLSPLAFLFNNANPSRYFVGLMITLTRTFVSNRSLEDESLRSMLSNVQSNKLILTPENFDQSVFTFLSQYIPTNMIAPKKAEENRDRVYSESKPTKGKVFVAPGFGAVINIPSDKDVKSRVESRVFNEELAEEDCIAYEEALQVLQTASGFKQEAMRIAGQILGAQAEDTGWIFLMAKRDFDQYKSTMDKRTILLVTLLRWYYSSRGIKDAHLERRNQKVLIDACKTILDEVKLSGRPEQASLAKLLSVQAVFSGGKLLSQLKLLFPRHQIDPNMEYVIKIRNAAKIISSTSYTTIAGKLLRNIALYTEANLNVLAAFTLCEWYLTTREAKKVYPTGSTSGYTEIFSRLNALAISGEAIFPPDLLALMPTNSAGSLGCLFNQIQKIAQPTPKATEKGSFSSSSINSMQDGAVALSDEVESESDDDDYGPVVKLDLSAEEKLVLRAEELHAATQAVALNNGLYTAVPTEKGATENCPDSVPIMLRGPQQTVVGKFSMFSSSPSRSAPPSSAEIQAQVIGFVKSIVGEELSEGDQLNVNHCVDEAFRSPNFAKALNATTDHENDRPAFVLYCVLLWYSLKYQSEGAGTQCGAAKTKLFNYLCRDESYTATGELSLALGPLEECHIPKRSYDTLNEIIEELFSGKVIKPVCAATVICKSQALGKP